MFNFIEFTKISKQYMAYGTKSMPKWKFWLKFPRALIRYIYYSWTD